MAVVITNRARKRIRDFYWNCTKKNIQRSQETNSLVDAMTKLINTTPLAISKENRGILELWKNKGYTIYESTHYFIRYGFGIDVKPMTTRNKMARKWYFACILDVTKDTIYIVNAIYAKYIDRMMDDTPTAQKFMSAIKGLETKKKRAQAKTTQLTIPFPENEAKIRLNRLIENNNATNKIINMNNKKVVRLTESKLHNIIMESVTRVLYEMRHNKNRASAKYGDGKIVVEIDLEDDCNVKWAYLCHGEIVDYGEMDIEVYVDGTWLPYEETHGPQRWIPKSLEPIVYRLFKKLGMRDEE